ncbi:RNA polymerase sigma factor [Gracilinema caldarium]|uniref:RNA polymerase sigma factor n=1 Tax=Gracilinema caldarium TaxID=215591 RepID=UPI0026F295B3|nr:RNA polymerase sigma factor [Gracilinema caldarium]
MNDSNMKTEDKILLAVQHVLAGDKNAFREIVEVYKDMLYRYCLARTGNEERAGDLVQEIFIRTYRALPSFKLGKQFSPWIFTIASNVLRSSWRRLKREQNIAEKLFYPDDPEQNNPEKDALQAETSAELLQALRNLPHELYEVLYLYYFEGLSVSEIAKTLSLGEENVKSRLFRGRKKIRQTMQPETLTKGIIE